MKKLNNMKNLLFTIFILISYSGYAQLDNKDKLVLDGLIDVIKSNDISLFDVNYPSNNNKQDKLLNIGDKEMTVLNRITKFSLFGGNAFNLSFYYMDKQIIMFEVAPADFTFSKNRFDNVVKGQPLYSFINQKGKMEIHNEFYTYGNMIINIWRPTKEYEFEKTDLIDGFKYITDDIFFLTITRKEIFKEMIEPNLL